MTALDKILKDGESKWSGHLVANLLEFLSTNTSMWNTILWNVVGRQTFRAKQF